MLTLKLAFVILGCGAHWTSAALVDKAELKNTNNLITSNLNGYYNSLGYIITKQDLLNLPQFNSTLVQNFAIAGHFVAILGGNNLAFFINKKAVLFLLTISTR